MRNIKQALIIAKLTIEENIRKNMEASAQKTLIPNRIVYKNISKEEEILDAMIWLFQRRKEVL